MSTEHIAILGTNPKLSSLELKRLGKLKDWWGSTIATVTADTDIAPLGGVIKLAEVVGEIPRSMEGIEQLYDIILQECERAIVTERTKIRFGFSVYAAESGINEQVARSYAKRLKRTGIDWKKRSKLEYPDISMRYVESKEPTLSSVIVDKERLLPSKTDFIIGIYKDRILLARTTAVQPYKDFSKRDYGRPQRDHKSGMLPPKIARMMVNIANPGPDDMIIDPFCGSGTIIQEALLLGHTNIAGSDTSSKAVEDATENLNWLLTNAHRLPDSSLTEVAQQYSPNIHVCDVRTIDSMFTPNSVQCIVAEGYLGPTRPKKTDKVHRQMRKLYLEAFKAMPNVLSPGARVVLAVPAWQRFDRLQTLEIEAEITQLGFKAFHKPIVYGREHAKVVRQILFLEYKG